MNQKPTSETLTSTEQAAIAKMRERSADKEAKTAAKIAEMRAREEIKTAAKIAEMRAREEIRAEREERRAAAKSKATAEWAEHQRIARKEKEAADKGTEKRRIKEQKRKAKERAKAAKFAAAEKAARAAERLERDMGKSTAIGGAKADRLKDREIREVQKDAEKELATDVKKSNNLWIYRRNKRLNKEDGFPPPKCSAAWMAPLTDWKPRQLLSLITDRCDLDQHPAVLAHFGLAVVDDGAALALVIRHRPTCEDLGLGLEYHLVLHEHPRVADKARAVWIGDAPQKCMIFSLPIDDPSPA